MLTLDLQFSRLDDVIHFSLRPPTVSNPSGQGKKNPRWECKFFEPRCPTVERNICAANA
jgi:hypothetical protein